MPGAAFAPLYSRRSSRRFSPQGTCSICIPRTHHRAPQREVHRLVRVHTSSVHQLSSQQAARTQTRACAARQTPAAECEVTGTAIPAAGFAIALGRPAPKYRDWTHSVSGTRHRDTQETHSVRPHPARPSRSGPCLPSACKSCLSLQQPCQPPTTNWP